MNMDITIPKGTMVKTTHPVGNAVSKREQVVNSFVSPRRSDAMWYGKAGYLRWVSVRDVIDANPELKEYIDDYWRMNDIKTMGI